MNRRIVSPIVPDPLLTDNVYHEPAAGYHNLGKLTQSRNSASTRYFGYNGNGAARYQGVQDANGWHQTYTIRIYGQTAYKSYNPAVLAFGSDTNRWQYDGAGRLKSIPDLITSQTYEPDGQTRKIVYANGVSTEFTYHAAIRRLTRILTKNAAGVALIDNDYRRDLSGRVTQILALGETDHWYHEYDDLDRLTRAYNYGDVSRQEYFTYDYADNLRSRTRMAGAYDYPLSTDPRPHMPTSVAGRPFSYDANGNLTSDGLKTLVWTHDNRLGSVVKGGQTTSFAYGPDGARARKVSVSLWNDVDPFESLVIPCD